MGQSTSRSSPVDPPLPPSAASGSSTAASDAASSQPPLSDLSASSKARHGRNTSSAFQTLRRKLTLSSSYRRSESTSATSTSGSSSKTLAVGGPEEDEDRDRKRRSFFLPRSLSSARRHSSTGEEKEERSQDAKQRWKPKHRRRATWVAALSPNRECSSPHEERRSESDATHQCEQDEGLGLVDERGVNPVSVQASGSSPITEAPVDTAVAEPSADDLATGSGHHSLFTGSAGSAAEATESLPNLRSLSPIRVTSSAAGRCLHHRSHSASGAWASHHTASHQVRGRPTSASFALPVTDATPLTPPTSPLQRFSAPRQPLLNDDAVSQRSEQNASPSWPAPPTTPPEERDAFLGERNAARELIAGILGLRRSAASATTARESRRRETMENEDPVVPDLIPLAPANAEGEVPIMLVPGPSRRIVVRRVVQSSMSTRATEAAGEGSQVEREGHEEVQRASSGATEADSDEAAAQMADVGGASEGSDVAGTREPVASADGPPTDTGGADGPSDLSETIPGALRSDPDDIPPPLTEPAAPAADGGSPTATTPAGPPSGSAILAQQATLIGRLLSIAAAVTAASLLPGTLNPDGTPRESASSVSTSDEAAPVREPPAPAPDGAVEDPAAEATQEPREANEEGAAGGLSATLRQALRSAFGDGMMRSRPSTSQGRSGTEAQSSESEATPSSGRDESASDGDSTATSTTPSSEARSGAHLFSALLRSAAPQADASVTSDGDSAGSEAHHAEPREGSFERFLRDLQADVGREILHNLGPVNGEGTHSERSESLVGQEGAGTPEDQGVLPASDTPPDSSTSQPAQSPETESSSNDDSPPRTQQQGEQFNRHRIFSFFRMHRFEPALASDTPEQAAAEQVPGGVPATSTRPEAAVGTQIVSEGRVVGTGSRAVPEEPRFDEGHRAGAAAPRTPWVPVLLVGVRSVPGGTSLPTEASGGTPPGADIIAGDLMGPSATAPSLSQTGGEGSEQVSREARMDMAGIATGAMTNDDAEEEREDDEGEERENGYEGENNANEDEDDDGDLPPLEEPSDDGGMPTATDDTGAAAESSPSVTNGDVNARSWLIFVLAGIYPASHPIFTAPQLFVPGGVSSGALDYETMVRIAELIGQHKPPTASQTDINQAGLRLVKTQELDAMAAKGEVLINTTERCLICLSDYEPDEDLRLMKCKHVFHRACVDQWLTTGRNSCPTCRETGVKPSQAASAPPVSPPDDAQTSPVQVPV